MVAIVRLRCLAGVLLWLTTLGCRPRQPAQRELSPLVGRWAWASHPRPAEQRRSVARLFSTRPDGRADIRYDTLTLRADQRYVTHASVARAVVDSSDHPVTMPLPIEGVPATIDSGQWRHVPRGADTAFGGGTLCTTHRGVQGWYCAPVSHRDDSLVLDSGPSRRVYRRVPLSSGAGGAAPGG
jgi:hypothetical protein